MKIKFEKDCIHIEYKNIFGDRTLDCIVRRKGCIILFTLYELLFNFTLIQYHINLPEKWIDRNITIPSKIIGMIDRFIG